MRYLWYHPKQYLKYFGIYDRVVRLMKPNAVSFISVTTLIPEPAPSGCCWWSRGDSLYHGLISHDIAHRTAAGYVQFRSDFKLTKETFLRNHSPCLKTRLFKIISRAQTTILFKIISRAKFWRIVHSNRLNKYDPKPGALRGWRPRLLCLYANSCV